MDDKLGGRMDGNKKTTIKNEKYKMDGRMDGKICVEKCVQNGC